ncbi:uncharacterized protein BO95DRAFT_253908 [Aspergillus brunneoviolaceus CBS 621.78]|uniref:Uncharacterized protein n=1 Tax=Aspergillus brunneoviolaceus CBS 621.78 TaxID=1450534 RepID=A0ACD1FY51_9EURO|nr:hypothetical protein BO95DRAFT_253908 [Aspergillus brunneoviolaceus CBS 621.78]RAH41887.1 hypothetical protein BO95DRAFT_253908 [Aspergillus brunneoviolaceus CBS 621.78]
MVSRTGESDGLRLHCYNILYILIGRACLGEIGFCFFFCFFSFFFNSHSLPFCLFAPVIVFPHSRIPHRMGGSSRCRCTAFVARVLFALDSVDGRVERACHDLTSLVGEGVFHHSSVA